MFNSAFSLRGSDGINSSVQVGETFLCFPCSDSTRHLCSTLVHDQPTYNVPTYNLQQVSASVAAIFLT